MTTFIGSQKIESLLSGEAIPSPEEVRATLEKARGLKGLTLEDVALLISASRPVPEQLLAELDRMIDEGMGADIKVKMNVLRQGEVIPATGETGNEPVVNE